MIELKHTLRRQTAQLADLGDAEIDIRLQAPVASCGQKWLEDAAGEPLQTLWSRRDGMATNQLVLIGDAFLSLTPVDSKWVAAQVRFIKGGDPNSRRRAMFELLGLNMLGASSVKPTPANYPGYDAVVTVADGTKILFSLKNYGTSTYERTFESESVETERVFIEALQKLRVTGLTLRAVARNYPAKADWQALRRALPVILGQANCGRGSLHPVEESWALFIADSPQEVLPLSNSHMSYQVLILAPYHANESNNLFDKLEDAAANARKHAGNAPGDAARAVLVRLPETISFAACREWAQNYAADNATGPIDFVLLYQPTISDTADGASSIDHAVVQCAAANYANWLRPGRELTFGVSAEALRGKAIARR